MASHLAVSMLYVTAMMGTVGRSFETRSAVLPLVVNAMIAFDLEISATCRIYTHVHVRAWRQIKRDGRWGFVFGKYGNCG